MSESGRHRGTQERLLDLLSLSTALVFLLVYRSFLLLLLLWFSLFTAHPLALLLSCFSVLRQATCPAAALDARARVSLCNRLLLFSLDVVAEECVSECACQ